MHTMLLYMFVLPRLVIVIIEILYCGNEEDKLEMIVKFLVVLLSTKF